MARGGPTSSHADTACDFLSDPPEFGCAYTHGIYTSGYRYRGRVQGHSIDADGESIGVGALFLDEGGHRWEILARNVKVNREGVAPEHSLAVEPAKVRDVSLTHERVYGSGSITLSLGYADVRAWLKIDP